MLSNDQKRKMLIKLVIGLLESDPSEWTQKCLNNRERLKEKGTHRWRRKLVPSDSKDAVFSMKNADHLHDETCKFADEGNGYTLESAAMLLSPCKYCVDRLRQVHLPRLRKMIDS